ncbi:MAG: hypothetical protein ACRDYD_08405, partial [Acidimicrobiales bacterium]
MASKVGAAALGASGWVTLGMIQLPAGWPIRWIAVAVFLVLCPGLAWVGLLRLRGTLDRLMV